MAEGLLRKALEAPQQKKQEFIHHAALYLAFARRQESSDSNATVSDSTHGDVEDAGLERPWGYLGNPR
jgi:hypothetical protein